MFPRSAVSLCAAPPAAALLCLGLGCAGRETKDEVAARTTKETPVPSGRAVEAVRKPPAPAPSGGKSPAAPAAPAAKTRARVYAKTRFVWVRIEPDTSKGWIGYLWIGGAAPLKTGKSRWGYGCTTWYEIEPRGFVCVDGRDATLDADDPVLVKLKPYAPKLDSAWPHHYGESRGLPRYDSVPSADEQRRREWDLAEQIKRVASAKTGDVDQLLSGIDLSPAKDEPIDLGRLPATLHENRRRYRPLSTVAWSHQVFDGQRSWLLTHDYTWVPKDRVAPYPEVTFKGVRIGQDAKMPLAFFRGKDRTKYQKSPAGELIETAQKWPRLAHIELTGNKINWKDETYLETRDNALWLKEGDAVVPKLREATPWGALVGSNAAPEPGKRRTWMEANIWKGWLIAYENTQPVYVTMISPGRGGTPIRGKDPLETASTPTGTFNITGKFATATMEAPDEFIHSDVPWTQNFSGAHALHGAYWHDDWGNRKSAGCINVSPIDGRWLFEFTEPATPEGWHGVRWRPGAEPSTLFIVQ